MSFDKKKKKKLSTDLPLAAELSSIGILTGEAGIAMGDSIDIGEAQLMTARVWGIPATSIEDVLNDGQMTYKPSDCL